jgi:hypothetical protein
VILPRPWQEKQACFPLPPQDPHVSAGWPPIVLLVVGAAQFEARDDGQLDELAGLWPGPPAVP